MQQETKINQLQQHVNTLYHRTSALIAFQTQCQNADLDGQLKSLHSKLHILRNQLPVEASNYLINHEEDLYIPSVESLIEHAILGERSVVGKPPCVSQEEWMSERQ
jgi:hypothetical protein